MLKYYYVFDVLEFKGLLDLIRNIFTYYLKAND